MKNGAPFICLPIQHRQPLTRNRMIRTSTRSTIVASIQRLQLRRRSIEWFRYLRHWSGSSRRTTPSLPARRSGRPLCEALETHAITVKTTPNHSNTVRQSDDGSARCGDLSTDPSICCKVWTSAVLSIVPATFEHSSNIREMFREVLVAGDTIPEDVTLTDTEIDAIWFGNGISPFVALYGGE